MIVDPSLNSYGKYCFVLYIRFQDTGCKYIEICLLPFLIFSNIKTNYLKMRGESTRKASYVWNI